MSGGRMIIGIAGKIGHGKDTIANYLVRAYGFMAVRLSDALKDEVEAKFAETCRAIAKLHRLEGTPVHTLVREIKPAGIRELLQEYGTEVRRSEDPEYWIRLWERAAAPYPKVVVPDVRFPNEAAAIARAGGHLWRVRRPALPALSIHASERFVDQYGGFEVTIVNDGTIADLEHRVSLVMLWRYGLRPNAFSPDA